MPPIRPLSALIVSSIGRAGRAASNNKIAMYNDARCLSSARRPASSRRSNDEDESIAADEPWWSLSSLHKKVATIIATSLPDESLSAVHKSLSHKLSEAESHKSVSINEAIVSARAREAHQQSKSSSSGIMNANTSHSIEHQKLLEKDIEQRALEMAQERMQLELKAMKEQLLRKEEDRVQKEREERERMQKEHARELAFEKWKDNAAKERKEEEAQLQNEGSAHKNSQEPLNNSCSNLTVRHHPILGQQIAQLPYKRIHLSSASTLASLPVYEKQRAYRHDRAQNMAKDKKKTIWIGIPGVISLMEDDDGRLSILDGQHRVGMMSLLEEERRKTREKGGNSSSSAHDELAQLDLDNILVEVFSSRKSDNDSVLASHQSEQDDRAAIFTEINKAEPIKLLDLPGVANKRTRDIIDHAASHFHDAFPAMFSSSQRCRSPHLNLDNFRDALFASEVIQREKIGSGGELVKWIAKRNNELRVRYESDDELAMDDQKKASQVALKKARKHDFYLGLESTWLYK